jgi:uncharacterized protein
MALKELIQNDMKTALLGGDRLRGNILRDLKAAILDEEVASGKREEGLNDDAIEKIVAREVKKRNESIKLYEQNDRPELAAAEKAEIAVISQYLPQQVSEAEIKAVVEDIITGIDGASMQHMGQVIGGVKAKLGNSADGSLVAAIVKQRLQV